MTKRHIMIAVPAYTGTVHVGTMRALVADIMGLLQRGDLVSLCDDIGSADLYDTRARTTMRFLQSECTHLMLVDHDVTWPRGAIPRLVDHDVEFVAGMYPKRQDPLTYDLQYLDNDARILPADTKTGLLEVAGVSAGFMRMTRGMIEKMVERYKDDPVAGLYTRDKDKAYALWDPYRLDGRKLGDDYSFCRRWRDMGGRIWIDPGFPMGHAGLKMFHAHFGDWLKQISTQKEAAE